MRFLVFSDAHGYTAGLLKAMELHGESDAVIFLGDGADDVRNISNAVKKPFYIVCGNCDFYSKEKIVDFIECGSHKILICHGHYLNVKYGLETLKDTARENGCDIALFGHTHIALTEYDDGLYIMNPGSVSDSRSPTYGILDITNAGIVINIAKIK